MKKSTQLEIKNLLLSTKGVFANLSVADLHAISAREAPLETLADQKIGAYLSEGLAKIVPDDTIITEDATPILGTSLSTWVIDPIDGTVPFISGVPTYMVSIYRLHSGNPDYAFAFNPITNDLYVCTGSETFRNGHVVHSSTKKTLVESRVAISGHALESLPILYNILRAAGVYVIVQEGLVFRSTLVANGQIDATIQIGLKQFESGAVYSLVSGAGGTVSSATSDELNLLGTTPNVVISNKYLHDKLKQLLIRAVNLKEKATICH